MLAVPLLREGEAIGVITVRRNEVGPFTDTQIALLQDLRRPGGDRHRERPPVRRAAQRTDDLRESLEYQTATSEVLEVIGRSTSDIQPVLDTMLSAALRLCGDQVRRDRDPTRAKGFVIVADIGAGDPEERVRNSRT